MKILITGGAGFIGCNLAAHFAKAGHAITIFDNLSRRGSESNLAWLRQLFGDSLNLIRADIRDAEATARAALGQEAIFHLAGQVAVTTSVQNPREDFEINALGTFNMLEAARLSGSNPVFIYTSTNKVYGGMEEEVVREGETRYEFERLAQGVPETYPLDFHSPYGCCYSEDTDVLTRCGWKRFYELTPTDEVLTYNLERKIAEFQGPTAHFAYPYAGKMYVQMNRRLETCVTPNHKMLVAWDRNHHGLEKPRLLEAQCIAGKPMAYLLGAEVEDGQECEQFVLPEVIGGKHKHDFPARALPMDDWLRFLGWYISEGHCYESEKTGNCTVTLTTYYRTEEAVAVMRAIGLSPVVEQHHVTATSKQLYTYLRPLGRSHHKHIPACIKALPRRQLAILLESLLAGDGNSQSKNSWRYTTVSKCLADDVQEIAIKCGLAASLAFDKEKFYRVYMGTALTAHCNLDGNRSKWMDYDGMVYCVEVPNSVVLVRQNGHAYFSGNSKGTGDQYVRDYHRIYGLRSIVFRQSCLAAHQAIVTPFGLKPISALRSGDVVHSGQGWTRVRRVWSTGTKPVRKLSTMNGLTVTLTSDHRVFRPHGLFSNRDFAYGDFLAVLPETNYMPTWEPVTAQVLDVETYLAAVRARTTDQRCLNEAQRLASRLLPLCGDNLLALTEIVGRLFGDGHLGIHRRQNRETPAYTVQHFGTEVELSEVSQQLGWLGLPTSQVIRWDATSELPNGHVINGTTCRIQQQSIPIFTLFEQLGVPVGDKVRVNYSLPEWVRQGPCLVKRAFLRGFFGAELCKVNADSYLAPSFAQSKDVDFRENGLHWMQQLRDLLAEFDIETSFFESSPTDYKRGTTIQMTVRLLGGKKMFEHLAGIGYAFNPERSQHLNALLRWQWQHTTPDHFEETVCLYRADGELFWDSLAQVEELGEQPVYDLEVEADTHLFVAGGIQVSNCIYGLRQFGVEDQGWLAHFAISAALGRGISIFGDGKQVRDVLFIDDLVRAFEMAVTRIDRTAGQVYNIGGGPASQLSVWRETGPLLEKLAEEPLKVTHGDWRPGDQRIYVSDIRKAKADFGWAPTVMPEEGMTRLWSWILANRQLFE